MIKIENEEVLGWEHAVRGMRNPKNSWEKSDSYTVQIDYQISDYVLGADDLRLASTLANAGTDHGKLLRFIQVYADITAPLYWWKEFDTYRAGVEKNSCSTMHKIHSKEFTYDDFSHEHLNDEEYYLLGTIIKALNLNREIYNEKKEKEYWWQMIQLLPTSFNQKRTCMMSYASLRNMYHARKLHKLDEWRMFCLWVETLPYAKELIIGDKQ